MPELMGFKENKDGEIVAIVNYPNARKFVLKPKLKQEPAAQPEQDKCQK